MNREKDVFFQHIALQKRENLLYSRWCRKRNISPVWLMILDSLRYESGKMEPSQLAAEQLLPRQTMTGLLDQLEKRGYVRRQRHEHDRRRLCVVLLPAGMEVLASYDKELCVLEQSAVQALSPEEMAQFNALYTKLVTAMEAQFAAAGE